MKKSEDYFRDIRPYKDSEVSEAINQLINDKHFKKAVEQIIKPITWEQFSALMLQCNSKYDFQSKIIHPVMTGLIKTTTTEMIGTGWDKNSDKESHIFISNHRDIVLDAAFS